LVTRSALAEGLDQVRDKVKKERERLKTERKLVSEKDKIWVETNYLEKPGWTWVNTTNLPLELSKLPIDEFLEKLNELKTDVINGGQDKNLHMSPDRIIDEILMPHNYKRGLKRLFGPVRS